MKVITEGSLIGQGKGIEVRNELTIQFFPEKVWLIVGDFRRYLVFDVHQQSLVYRRSADDEQALVFGQG